ncbi:MAG TPA: GNAT family N-acetyltransferase, partial [Chthoniobacterales bacterium]
MTEETVSIRPADPFAPESLRLIEQLWSELGALYPEVNGPPFPPKDIVGDRAVFVLAWSGDQAIACGALRPFPSGDFSIGEIKRMFVAPHARGHGGGSSDSCEAGGTGFELRLSERAMSVAIPSAGNST